ncbi:hypothetical protein J2X97_001659 [Epilithonimonas hungarica]|uniref:hypothetical protein n=1 Tax=Epilithonimonas hungarica TaxID=454006 RepID=UPI00277F0112|nr:hypothetical protein [Epilithonimonas hungarica]MDP9956022.1 hypothetical protein [Epilithonimonas hungarica]
MESLLREEIQLCTSQIQLKDRKIFWLAVFEFEKEEYPLKPEIIEKAFLSLEHPIVAKANNVRSILYQKKSFCIAGWRFRQVRKGFKRASPLPVPETEPNGNKKHFTKQKIWKVGTPAIGFMCIAGSLLIFTSNNR